MYESLSLAFWLASLVVVLALFGFGGLFFVVPSAFFRLCRTPCDMSFLFTSVFRLRCNGGLPSRIATAADDEEDEDDEGEE